MKAHVIGGGLAGLAAAVELASSGARVTLYEAAPRLGGRCRSYFDPALGQTIDNGNHLVFSGNQAVAAYLAQISASDRLTGPARAEFAFHDLTDGARWRLRINDGRLPWWVFSRHRRAPGTNIADHLALARLLCAPREAQIGTVIGSRGAFWRRVVEPMMVAVLNTPAAEGSAWLAARFLRESFGRGGHACRPLVATPTLEAAFVQPALAFLAARGARVRTGARLRGLSAAAGRVISLDFGEAPVQVGPDAAVILAVPPWVASDLLSGLTAPTRFTSILNAHFAVMVPPNTPLISALVGGTAQWVVAHEERVSVTVSAADALIDDDRAGLAERLWADVSASLGIAGPMPAWQIVKEKRATFAATPDQVARRPRPRTPQANLFLAGDWTDTGLPATIEGALRSGVNAALLAMGRPMRYRAG